MSCTHDAAVSAVARNKKRGNDCKGPRTPPACYAAKLHELTEDDIEAPIGRLAESAASGVVSPELRNWQCRHEKGPR